MSVQTLHDTGSSYQVLSKYDGGVYAAAVEDCVISGIGDEFTLNYSNNSLNVSFLAGSQAVIGGSFFKITADETVTLPANTSNIYLCARIDTSKANGSRGSFESLTLAGMKSENINGSGTKRDMALYVINTNGSGVTSVTDVRKYNSVPQNIDYGTSLPGSANEGDIFLLYEA